METSQKAKRSNVKFNIMDFLIILIVLMCVISLIARYTTVLKRIGLSNHLQQYEISFAASDLRYTTPSFIKIDDKVYLDDGSNTLVGTLLSRELGSADALTITLSSEYIQTDVGFISAYYAENTLVDISGRLLCEGRINDEGYFLLGGNVYLSEGQTVSVCTDLVSFELTVTDITLCRRPPILRISHLSAETATALISLLVTATLFL